jgi:hypothetical protein
MNIQTVAANLRNTIAGKEELLAEYQEARKLATMAEDSALFATVSLLKVNIDELRRILQDVEQCAKQASDDSWITNPDRMGGGGWTADELDPNRGWK